MILNQLTYINLDSSTDRLSFITDQLNSIPNTIKIFKTSGIIIPIEEIHLFKTNNKKLIQKESFRGTVGCYLSHKKAIQELSIRVEPNNNFSMVIEDDIFIHPNFWQEIDNLLIDDNSIDIIFFDNTRAQKITSKTLYEIPKYHGKYNGAFCYAIRNSSLIKVYEMLNNRRLINHVDHTMYNSHAIKTYGYKSNLISVNYHFTSDRLSNQ